MSANQDNQNSLSEQIQQTQALLTEQAQQTRKTLAELVANQPELTLDFTELKHFISEENEHEKYQLKALIEDRQSATASQLQSLKISMKDEDILSKMPSIYNQVCDTETHLHKQIRTVKILAGLSIWTSLLTLGLITAYILGYL